MAPEVRPGRNECLLAEADPNTDHRAMRAIVNSRRVGSTMAAGLVAVLFAAPAGAIHGEPHVVLQQGTNGCTGVLPSTDGNTDMRLVGGSLTPGGTAVFEISYPVNASSVGKEFTINDCAFINDVPALKYTVSFVPSNQSFVLRMTLGIPEDAPVGGLYCNYAKTTGSPTAAQASQRKAGPACFVIRAPRGPASSPEDPNAPNVPIGTSSTPILLPDTAMAAPGAAP
jgi:hypothetical protein